jgi:hypothetical protein
LTRPQGGVTLKASLRSTFALLIGVVCGAWVEASAERAFAAPGDGPPKSGAVNFKALLIGIEDYKADFPSLSPYVANDLTEMRKALVAIGYAPDNITIVTNSFPFRNDESRNTQYLPQLSRTEITNVVMDAIEQDTARDSWLVYVSGHGATLQDQRFVATWDSRPANGDSYVATSAIAGHLAASRAKRRLLIIDTCASASIARGNLSVGHGELGVDQIFSSRLQQASAVDPTSKMSLFTSHLVKALLSADDRGTPDGVLTTNEVFDDVERRMTEHWKPRPGIASCSDVMATNDPFDGTGAAPEQCPSRIAGPAFAIAMPGRTKGKCDALTKTANESISSFMDRYQACRAAEREAAVQQ